MQDRLFFKNVWNLATMFWESVRTWIFDVREESSTACICWGQQIKMGGVCNIELSGKDSETEISENSKMSKILIWKCAMPKVTESEGMVVLGTPES